MPHSKIQIVHGKLVKPKKNNLQVTSNKTNVKSTTEIKKDFVEDKDPEMQFLGEGFNTKSFILQRPKKLQKQINQSKSDVITGLGLLSFGSSLQPTKSKNIKLII